MEYGNDQLRFKHEADPAPESGMFMRHAHHEYELIYFLQGDAQCIIEQRRHRLKPLELVVIPPMYYHFIKIEQSVPYERAVVSFLACDARPEVLEQVFNTPRVIDLTDAPELRAVLERMEQYADFEPRDRELLSRNLLTELIYLLSRRENDDRAFSPYFNDTITAAVQYIDGHLTTITSPNEIHEALFVSRIQLYRSFQEALGIPPMKYINEKRLLLADARIRGGERPSHAAAACGFNEYSTFFRLYKRRFGHAPSVKR